jgi:hypothetical protein
MESLHTYGNKRLQFSALVCPLLGDNSSINRATMSQECSCADMQCLSIFAGTCQLKSVGVTKALGPAPILMCSDMHVHPLHVAACVPPMSRLAARVAQGLADPLALACLADVEKNPQ